LSHPLWKLWKAGSKCKGTLNRICGQTTFAASDYLQKVKMSKVVNRPTFAAGITDEEYTKWWIECDSEKRKYLLDNFGGEVSIQVKIAQKKWEVMKRD
jgi:hypothetical protein